MYLTDLCSLCLNRFYSQGTYRDRATKKRQLPWITLKNRMWNYVIVKQTSTQYNCPLSF